MSEAHTILDEATAEPMPAAGAAPVPAGRERLGGKIYWRDQKDRLIPEEAVGAVDKLMDEAVRKIIDYALPLEAQIQRFKQHCLDDIYGHIALLDQEYGVKRGGLRGNITLATFNGCMMVKIQVAEQIVFGPELQAAKALVDELLNEWTAEAAAPLRTIVASAFDVDKQHKISPHALFALLRHDIEDSRWKRAMDAIRDSVRPVGSKEYVRFYVRENNRAEWRPVVIDLARA